ncbi:MAG: DUF3788 domain-containing protein [Candidatus Cloacimonetes bacterium]|nr:DUF3788 domain-containing protein [Candidatus Cloacimonadota bacterium]
MGERLTDKYRKPGPADILEHIGSARNYWLELTDYLAEYYDIEPETVFYGASYGWTVRYRKSGKTLCSLFPEKNSLIILIILGGKELTRVNAAVNNINSRIRQQIAATPRLHDGCWLWIDIRESSDIESIKFMLSTKRKTKKQIQG